MEGTEGTEGTEVFMKKIGKKTAKKAGKKKDAAVDPQEEATVSAKPDYGPGDWVEHVKDPRMIGLVVAVAPADETGRWKVKVKGVANWVPGDWLRKAADGGEGMR